MTAGTTVSAKLALRMGTKSLVEPVLEALNAALRPHGYVRSGSTFRLRGADTIQIVSLQSSSSSTSEVAKVTINLGVHVLALQDPERPEVNPSVWSTHWNERIGHLLPEDRDIWWSIHSQADAQSVAVEAVRYVQEYGFPALSKVSTVSALRQLWESGRSPGLTKAQRIRCLKQLIE